jgi:hypothetical protein
LAAITGLPETWLVEAHWSFAEPDSEFWRGKPAQ